MLGFDGGWKTGGVLGLDGVIGVCGEKAFEGDGRVGVGESDVDGKFGRLSDCEAVNMVTRSDWFIVIGQIKQYHALSIWSLAHLHYRVQLHPEHHVFRDTYFQSVRYIVLHLV